MEGWNKWQNGKIRNCWQIEKSNGNRKKKSEKIYINQNH